MDACQCCGPIPGIVDSAMGVPSRPPSSYGASDRRDVHCGGREAFSRLARRREVSHLARLGLVLRIRAAFADCVLPSGALLLVECLVLRGLEEGRPALLRTVATNRGGRRLAGRPFMCAYADGVLTHLCRTPSVAASFSFGRGGEVPRSSLGGVSSHLAAPKIPRRAGAAPSAPAVTAL
jgi:hypothetical protein